MCGIARPPKTGYNLIVQRKWRLHQFWLVYASNTGERHPTTGTRGGVALFLFLICILLKVLLVDNDDQRFCFWIVFRNELFSFG